MENKENKEFKVISLLNNGKWESYARKLMPSNVVNNNGNGISIEFDMSLMSKLNKGMMSNSLIYTYNIRGIGKTTVLVDFAKTHGLHILCKTVSQKRTLETNYNFSNAHTLNEARGRIQYTFVVDEGFTIDEIQELRDKKGINIVTGFINTLENKITDENSLLGTISIPNTIPKEEFLETISSIKSKAISSNCNDDINTKELINTLNYEINSLLTMLKKTREHNDIGTYKNLIQALTNVLNTKHIEEENKMNSIIKSKRPQEPTIDEIIHKFNFDSILKDIDINNIDNIKNYMAKMYLIGLDSGYNDLMLTILNQLKVVKR